MRQIDLGFDLHAIAAVDKDPGKIGGDDAKPGTAGKAGQPCQPRIMGRDIFPLMGVGARHDEAIQIARHQRAAQIRQPRWVDFG